MNVGYLHNILFSIIFVLICLIAIQPPTQAVLPQLCLILFGLWVQIVVTQGNKFAGYPALVLSSGSSACHLHSKQASGVPA